MIRPQTCPICDKELAADAGTTCIYFPFCSERCRLIDFYRWCEGKYAVIEPVDPGSLDAEADSQDE